MAAERSTGHCSARAAIAGNPSDMYGGAVVAVPVRSVAASVTVVASEAFELPGLDRSPSTIDELDNVVAASGCGTVQPLVAATLIALWRRLDADISPVSVEVSTAIPRGVGFAGSSAIVIATIRALVQRQPGTTWARLLGTDPWVLAATALHAETSVLGIAAGMQDRLVQSLGDNAFMDFSHRSTATDTSDSGRFRLLGPLPGAAFVAFRSDDASDSGAVHARADTSTTSFDTAMAGLARAAHGAATAIDADDARGLGIAMDATFDLRASCMDLDPAHVEMVHTARSQGAAATYTGSGGAITVLCTDRDHASATAARLRNDLGCQILPLPWTEARTTWRGTR